MNKKILVAIIIAILIGTMALPVFAKRPDRFTDSFTEAPMLIADCGDYEVWTKDSQLYLNGTIHYDNEGSPIMIITHWKVEDTYWSPETLKEVSVDVKLFNSVEVLATGEFQSAGIQFRLTLPGEGTILMDVGRYVFDADFNIIFKSGKHPVFFPEEGGTEKLCAFFAD